MSGSTSVPSPLFTTTGFLVPVESDILAGVQADMNAAFGGNLNPGLSTPQGQLASSFAAIIADKNSQFLQFSQQFDPNFASGRYQDALARIYYITRNPAQPTVVQVQCNGAVNTPIPTGALITAQDGNQYICVAGGTIPSSGILLLSFACVTAGPIVCPPQTFTIYSTVPGWDTAISTANGVIGNLTETRAEFEQRRSASVAQNSVNPNAAVLGAVLSVANVIDAYVIDNPTNGSNTVGGVVLPANSLYICVAGGDPQQVAQAIWSKKAPGCSYFPGNITETVQDTQSGYSYPYPSYQVSFQSALSEPILFNIQIANTTQVPSDAQTQITNAILYAFAGLDGGPRARIGSRIFASRFYSGISGLGTWPEILTIDIGTPTSAQFTGSVSGNTLTVSAIASGSLAIGQIITGANLSKQAVITQFQSGTGGTGTYTLSVSETAASGTMFAATLFKSVQMNINQIPTVSAANITVTLV